MEGQKLWGFLWTLDMLWGVPYPNLAQEHVGINH
jgi:hypothetical protein